MNAENKLAIPIAIVIAGVLIAGAVFLANRTPSNPLIPGNTGTSAKVKPVTSADHILGNPNAPIVIVEYTDLECPFCKSFHATMQQVMNTYGRDGKVAWVVRHFPLTQLHSKAPKEAEATECAAELGGNDAFWAYIDRVFAITPSNDGLDLAQLPVIAEEIGLNRGAFEACLASGKYTAAVQESFNEAVSVGARGTPHNFIITEDNTISVEGAQPFDAMKSLIDTILNAKTNPGVEQVPVINP